MVNSRWAAWVAASEWLLDAAITRLDALAARTTGAALRWVWLKALGITGVCWGVMLAAVALLL
jgi:hypothetical protein